MPPYGQFLKFTLFAPIASPLIEIIVYYQLFDADPLRAKRVLKSNTFLGAQDDRIGRVDIANLGDPNTVKGVGRAIAAQEDCGATFDSCSVEYWDSCNRDYKLPPNHPLTSEDLGATQDWPLIIRFPVSIDIERKQANSGALSYRLHMPFVVDTSNQFWPVIPEKMGRV